MLKKTGMRGALRVRPVLLIVLAVCVAAAAVAYFCASDRTEIFEMVEFGTNFQNNRILVKSDMTYLGTYQNTILAFDKAGNDIWSYGISGAIGAMEFDEDRNRLIIGSQDRNVYIFDGTDGELLAKYPAPGKVYDLDYDRAAGQLLISSSMSDSKHFISAMDIETGELILDVKIKQIARSARFSPDYQYFYYGDSRGRVYKLDRNGENVASGKATTEVRSLVVSHTTGEVYALDVKGNLFKYDEDLNQKFAVSLVGEGRTVGVSDDGKWVAAGTREGDVYILDSDGAVHFTARQAHDISQVYFGEDVSYVVTLSPELFRFSTARLDSIGLMSSLSVWSLRAVIVLSVLLAAALVAYFPRSRYLALRFFRTAYKHRVAYLMLLPSIVLILIFNYYNILQAFYYAFTDWSLATKTMREVNFIGFDNFVKMITEGYFLLGTRNLLIMMACSFLKLLTIPLLLAELVFSMRNRHGESSRRRYWFRLLLVAPMVVPGVVSTLMWKNIYDPNIGALNSILGSVGLTGWKHSWLGDPSTALWAVIFMGFPWVNSFAFLVYYGGLINIPQDLFEAAKVDGSSPGWNFIHIHLPLISPQLKMLVITTFINSVQDYGHIYLLTQGGPGTSTYVPGLELYYAATKFGQYGYACAMGLVMFIVILAGSLLNLRLKTHELN